MTPHRTRATALHQSAPKRCFSVIFGGFGLLWGMLQAVKIGGIGELACDEAICAECSQHLRDVAHRTTTLRGKRSLAHEGHTACIHVQSQHGVQFLRVGIDDGGGDEFTRQQHP